MLSACSTPDSTDNGGGPERVLNAHMHSARIGMSDAEYFAEVVAEMDAAGISQTVLHLNEMSDVEDWAQKAPDRFFAGPAFPCVSHGPTRPRSCSWDDGDWPSIEWLRERYEDGSFTIMGELLYVYAGIEPDDDRFTPYWALAAELDIPVFVHINRGPPPDFPSRPPGCCPNFNADLGDPALLRPVLERHADLRIVLQHAGFPALPMLGGIDYLDQTFALLQDYPGVYVDMTIVNSLMPVEMHEGVVRDFRDRGFIDRIVFGTDNTEAQPIIDRIRGMDFLSEDERRAILYDNAASFLRLD